MNQIGEVIKQLRKAHGLTQEALASKYGMSRSTISGIENGTLNEIGLRKVEAILAGFGYELVAAAKRRGRPTLDELKKGGFHD